MKKYFFVLFAFCIFFSCKTYAEEKAVYEGIYIILDDQSVILFYEDGQLMGNLKDFKVRFYPESS